jgi:hypothetical protein
MLASLVRRLAGPLAAVTVAVAVLTIPGTASADPTTGTITGLITGPDGAPAAGEVVHIDRSTWPPVSWTATTDSTGTYSVADLPPADGYRVSVNRPAGRQYAHGKTDSNLADQFTVTSGGTTTVNERLLPVGTFTLTLTEWTGQPAPSAQVILTDQGRGYSASGLTDAAGHITLTVFAGPFEVLLMPKGASGGLNFAREQFLHGKVRPEKPDVITVAPDGVTTVAEQLLQPGGLAITARDAVTGAPVSDFCVSHTSGGGCATGTGPVTVTDIRPGPFSLLVYTNDGDYLMADPAPVVVGGQTTPYTADLRPAGRLATTIVAADTGAPLEGACVALVKAGTGNLPDDTSDCSDASGTLTAGRIEPGDYHVFVRAPAGSGYGAQWVGQSGGVGTATRATTVTVTGAATATFPTIRLDRAGTISGVLRSEAGVPIAWGTVSLHSFGQGGGAPSFTADVDSTGAYRFDWLGPYEWPLLFAVQEHAWQWSGGQADRRRATGIRVRAGQTTTYSPTLRVGTVLTGTVTNAAGQPLPAQLRLRNTATGELMGSGYTEADTYRCLVLGPQDVKLNWFSGEQGGWYDNAGDFASATRIPIPRGGTKTLNLVLNI